MVIRSTSVLAALALSATAAPPFHGTIFLDPDIITAKDATTYLSVEPAGRGERSMFDRRHDGLVKVNAWLFRARFADSRDIEVQVNPEFDEKNAAAHAAKFAGVIGRLPKCLRVDVDCVWIHDGAQLFGGGNRSLLIHTGQAAEYESDGILEETLVHEASHTSLDDRHAADKDWLAAQKSDPGFISTYARDNPTQEDVAETFLLWLAVRHRADRIDPSLASTVHKVVPNRLRYFDERKFDVFPVK